MRTAADSCVECGALITPTTLFVTARGNVCTSCFARAQSAEDAERLEARLAEARERSLSRRARLLGCVHVVIWGSVVMLAGRSARLPGALTNSLLVVPIALLVGLCLRARWAYWAALAVDAGGVLALILVAATRSGSTVAWPLLIVAVFPAFMGFLVWSLRRAFPAAGPSRSGVPPATSARL